MGLVQINVGGLCKLFVLISYHIFVGQGCFWLQAVMGFFVFVICKLWWFKLGCFIY